MINAGPPKGLEMIGKYVKNRISEVSQDKYARYFLNIILK